MSLSQAIVLAVVQGLTEFLPVSSSGHLVLASWLFDWQDQGLVYDAAVHLATLAAVLIYFQRTWIRLVRGFFTNGRVLLIEDGGEENEMPARKLVWMLVLASIPVAVLGLLLKDALETMMRKPEEVGIALLVTAALLVVAEVVGKRSTRLASITIRETMFAGLFQAIALIPGVSRAGSTMAGGMVGGLTRDAAARLSFLLAVPAIGGSGLFLMLDVIQSEGLGERPWGMIILGAIIAFITGYVAIAWFMRVLRTMSFRPFIAYVAIVGFAVLVARAFGA
jgi:undecaprenyl-diphosphatase